MKSCQGDQALQYFALRSKQSKAGDGRALETACGRLRTETRYVDSAETEKMDIFAGKKMTHSLHFNYLQKTMPAEPVTVLNR